MMGVLMGRVGGWGGVCRRVCERGGVCMRSMNGEGHGLTRVGAEEQWQREGEPRRQVEHETNLRRHRQCLRWG